MTNAIAIATTCTRRELNIFIKQEGGTTTISKHCKFPKIYNNFVSRAKANVVQWFRVWMAPHLSFWQILEADYWAKVTSISGAYRLPNQSLSNGQKIRIINYMIPGTCH